MKVTVVTPSFNQGKWISQTIESIWSQSGDFYIEHFIMDGGSTDGTVEVIKKYEAALPAWPVRCKGISFNWISEKDGGQSAAINKGFRQATGDYIAWLNSDDTYEPGAIEKALGYLEGNPEKMMAYGEGYYLYEPGGNKKRYPVEGLFDYKRLAAACFITQPSVFLRRDVLEKVGFVDEALHFCMDYDWWIRIGKACKVGYIPEYLANTRVYPETKTESGRGKAFWEIIQTVKKHYGFVYDGWIFSYVDAHLESRMKNNTPLFFALRASLCFHLYVRLNRKLPPLPSTKRIKNLFIPYVKSAD